jgi:hypothetical protein
MEFTARIAKSFQAKTQQRSMMPDERLAITKALRDRAFGTDGPDVRQAERERRPETGDRTASRPTRARASDSWRRIGRCTLPANRWSRSDRGDDELGGCRG